MDFDGFVPRVPIFKIKPELVRNTRLKILLVYLAQSSSQENQESDFILAPCHA